MATITPAPPQKLVASRVASINPLAPAQSAVDKILKLREDAQKKVLEYAGKVLEKSKNFEGLKNKMDAIDIAYARYTAARQKPSTDGVDPLPATSGVACDIFADDDVVPPIVVSQVDSYVAYLADVFLSGSPLFPVVSSPAKQVFAEQLEALMDTHANIGGYARQLLLFIRDGAKYNFCALEANWDSMSQFSVTDDINVPGGRGVKKNNKKFTRVTRLNPRNVVWDYSLPPGDVAEHGDFAGKLERLTRTKLKRLLNKWQAEGKAYNIDKAFQFIGSNSVGMTPNYREDPQISDYVVTGIPHGVDWDAHFEGTKGRKNMPGPNVTGAIYEVFTLYARIMPADFGITAPSPNTPQIWKFVIVNNALMVFADRIISAYDYLPILFGQPLEDGLGYQTQSIAEGEIPFQKAANTLFNIRFAAARRAVSDRALYIPDMISPSDVNSKAAAPKIPVAISALSNKTIGDAYHPIPFDMRGTETTIQDASTIVQFSRDLHGVNGPRQGQFQKGNKSVAEWNDTMGGSDGRLRLPALTLEHQVFSPLKSILALNIFQYGEDGTVISQVTGRELNVEVDKLRKAALAFKIADGYTPKSKLASTEVILAGMQMIGNSPILQQSYGARLPAMFAHFMSLSGVKGFEQYDPQYQDPDAAATPGNLATNAIAGQAPALPIPAGQPPMMQAPANVPTGGAGMPMQPMP